MELPTILARSLLDYPEEYLWDNLVGEFNLKFDDGKLVKTNNRETILSRYFWRFHKQYPLSKLKSSHHVRSIIKDGFYSSKTTNKLFEKILWDVFKDYMELGNFIHCDELSKLMYEINNDIYNVTSERISHCAMSLCGFDYIEIMNLDEVKEKVNNVLPTHEDIDLAYKILKKIFHSKDILPNNPLVKMTKSGLVKEVQALQCLGPRGYLTDIDSYVFSKPITVGYLKGFENIYDSLIESRSAAKSLFFSKSDLQDAEYLSRKIQILDFTVKNLHLGDCGSEHYLLFTVKPPEKDEKGSVIFEGDLEELNGKFYLDENTNTLKHIDLDSTHLYGKTIKLRSPIAGCLHPDPNGVCSTCFGVMAYQVPRNTNIGHYCAVTLLAKLVQLILSTKHFDGTAKIEKIMLSNNEALFLKIAKDDRSYQLLDTFKNKKPKLIFTSEDLHSISTLQYIDKVENLSANRISDVTVVGFQYEDKKGNIFADSFFVGNGKTKGFLTYNMLDYIKTKGFILDSDNNIVVNMDDWDFSAPFITLPAKQKNMSDVAKSISLLIESRMSTLKTRKKENTTAASILFELYDICQKHFKTNLAVLEIILLGSMVVDSDNRDFRIPKGQETANVGVSKFTLKNRSLSAAFAYQDQHNIALSPFSFNPENRPSSPMDVFIMPQETVIQYEKNKLLGFIS